MTNSERLDELAATLQREIIARESLEIELKTIESKYSASKQSVCDTESRYLAVVEAIPDPIFIVDSEGIYLEFISSPGFDPLYPAEEFLGKSVREIMPSDLADTTMHCIKEALRTEKMQRYDYDLLLGEERQRFEARMVPTGQDSVLAIVRDITLRMHAEEELQGSNDELEQQIEERTTELIQKNQALLEEIAKREAADQMLRTSRARFVNIIDVASDAIISIDESQTIILFNRGAEKIFGYSANDIIGQSLSLLIPQVSQKIHGEHIRNFTLGSTPARKMGERRTIHGQRKNGEEFPAEAAISKVELEGRIIYTAILRDITVRRQNEILLQNQREELAHMQRTAAMGELTAAVAHEINQPLTAIRSNAQAAKRFMNEVTPDLDEVRAILEDIIDDNKRAAEVITRLRSFLRKQVVETELYDVDAIVKDVVNMLKSDSIIRGVSITLELANNLPLVLCDHIQIQQVLLNLIVNGFDAMEGNDNGSELTIRTSIKKGAEVQIAVKDCGVGFDDYGADQLFKPFHTSKRKGMGIGLTISRSIIDAHNGAIWAEPNQERGATVYVSLPVAAVE